MRRVIHLVALLAMLLSTTVLGATAQEASPESEGSLLAELGLPELRVSTDGTQTDLPAEIEAGRYHLILENESELGVDLELYQLPDGVTTDDLMAAFEEFANPEAVPPDFFYDMIFNGGPSSAAGETGEVVLDLTPGEWVVNVYAYDPESEEDPGTNTLQTLTVTGEMPEVEDIEGAVEITFAEMYFELPEAIASGPQIWKLMNNGLQPHHMILLGVPDGTTKEQVLELANSFGPPASPEAGATPVEPALSFEDVEDVFASLVFSEGQANWFELDVEPGTYAAVCFLPDPTGKPHVMLGMIEVFTVE